MRFLFIYLFIIFQLSISVSLRAQASSDTKATRWANEVLTKLNLEQQLSLLLWSSDSSEIKNNVGGVISNNPTLIARENNDLLVYTILNIYEGVPTSEQSAVPFPSFATRKKSSEQSYSFAKEVYQPDFVIDVVNNENTLFYGVEINKTKLRLTPHADKDSLLFAITHYDQVWWLAPSNEAVLAITNGKNPSKKLKILIYNLAQKALIYKYFINESKQKNNKSINKDDYIRWAWHQYSSSIALLNNPAQLPIKILDTAYFSTATLNQDEFFLFRRHLNFYVSHAYYAKALDFENSYNLKRLSNYDYLTVPATTLTNTQIDNINTLSEKIKVILIWYNINPPPKSIKANITQILVPEHNGVTEVLIPQLIFGALGFTSVESSIEYAPSSITTFPLGRLQFGPPALAYLDSNILSKIDTLVENGVRQQAMPGSQVLVAKNGIVVYYQNFGHKTYEFTGSINDGLLYDLASLTKVMATTQAIMFLVERGLLDLDMPIAHYLPKMWDSDKAFIPVREILAHQAGLFPYIPFWKEVLPKRNLENALSHKNSKGAYQVGNDTYIAPYLTDSLFSWTIHSKRLSKSDAEQPYGYRYSDIGFIILKTLVERLINQPLDDFLDQNIYAPLGMNHTTFNPLCRFSEDEIVPTEGNGKFRIGELTGYVNDQNAALLGGVSGHAGLFSNAIDLAKLMQLQLQLGSYGGTTYFYPETILNFTRRQYVDNRRGLGWDKPSRMSNGPTTDLASQNTFGHTGFTGTAAWADPDHQMLFVFLSNRVYPDAGNFKLNELNIRTRIQGLLYEAIDFNN